MPSEAARCNHDRLFPGRVYAVYRQIDPLTGVRLGRPRGRYPTFADHLARLKAAEPGATTERLIELERQAARHAARRLHRRDRLVLQVHLGAARLPPRERAARSAGRRPAGGDVLGRAMRPVP